MYRKWSFELVEVVVIYEVNEFLRKRFEEKIIIGDLMGVINMFKGIGVN